MKPAIAIIQARLSSTRLPGKVLMHLSGKPMIWHIVQRARSCQFVDRVVVATSLESSDNELAKYCYEEDIECFRGSLPNVLSRYLDIIQDSGHEYFVRITGDAPLIHPEFIDKQILALNQNDGDFVWLNEYTPSLDSQGVFSSRSLKTVASYTNHPDDLEHVGSRYLMENPERFSIIGLCPPESLVKAKWRLSVDERADYELMKCLYELLWSGEPFSLYDAFSLMENNPTIASINNSVQHSAINQELSAKRGQFASYISLFCDWDALNIHVS